MSSEHHSKDYSHPKTLGEYARIYFTGFAMGAADIVPGVSGGTMAFILGVYETLLNAIKSANVQAIKLALGFKFGELFTHIPVRFLIPLALGLGTAILALSNVLGTLLEEQPTFVFAFFGGLILASIVAVGVRVTWTIGTLTSFAIATVAAFIVVGLPVLDDAAHDPLTLFVSGMIAICAMLLPGISGSFILLVLGQYKYILDAVRNRDLLALVVFAMGCLVGILAFARLISFLLRRYEMVTIAALTGVMLGSLRTIWERMSAGSTTVADFGAGHVALAVGLAVVGFVIVSVLDHLQSGNNPLVAPILGRRGAEA
jgi:putative membrane protein